MRIKHFLPAVLTLVLFTAAQFAQAASLPEFSELAAKCGPAVVNIICIIVGIIAALALDRFNSRVDVPQ